MRKSSSSAVNSIDGVYHDIHDHFTTLYDGLYKSKLESLFAAIDSQVKQDDFLKIHKITADMVNKTVSHLKKNKTDPVLTSA